MQLWTKRQVTIWYSSQELFFAWDGQKRHLPLTSESGFAAGQISQVDQAVATLTDMVKEINHGQSSPFSLLAATVFLPTSSSPLEKKITRQVFSQAGFQTVNLMSYLTALTTFAQRQSIRVGAGVYVSPDLSEGFVYSPQEQESIVLHHSLLKSAQLVKELIGEQIKLEISTATAQQLYLKIGRQNAAFSQVIRGRSTTDQQVATKHLSEKIIGDLRMNLEREVDGALKPLLSLPLLVSANPQHWLIVGDGLVNQVLQAKYQLNTVFLQSAPEVIQGVQWLV